jgi:hypothetical protein
MAHVEWDMPMTLINASWMYAVHVDPRTPNLSNATIVPLVYRQVGKKRPVSSSYHKFECNLVHPVPAVRLL